MLPYLAEFIISLRLNTQTQDTLVEQAGGHILIPIFPPNTTVNIIVPPSASYASIGYRYILGTDMVPSAFNFTFKHKGRDIRVTALTGAGLREGFWTHALVTQKAPIFFSLTNTSGMNQYVEVLSFYIPVATENDLLVLFEAMEDLYNKGAYEFRGETLKLFTELRDWMRSH